MMKSITSITRSRIFVIVPSLKLKLKINLFKQGYEKVYIS